MDRYEFKVRLEEISNLINQEKYADAADIADEIDWRRVKPAAVLLKIAALYRVNRRNEDAREVLLLAYRRYPTNRSVVYFLCEVSIELDDVVAAVEYYKIFVKLAPKDTGVYTLRYRILEAQEVSLEERIALLEELKKRDYQEEWAYELAYLYHRAGFATKCVEECDDIILFFGDGAYVMKAMELKMLHTPLTESQKAKYDIMASNADRNYSSEAYNDNNAYSTQHSYTEEYPETGYDGKQGYSQDNYGSQQYYAEAGYEGQQDYTEAGYEDQQYYTGAGYEDRQDYAEAGYEGRQDYAEAGYEGQQDYTEAGYGGQQGYAEGYQPEYFETYGGNNGTYNESYPPNGDNSDDASTDEFYVEQYYNTDGYPISAPNEAPSQNANALAASDMSQYSTINLQKVVAESMKELFPDDNDDVFSEENLDLEPESNSETRTYISPKERLEGIQKEEREKQAPQKDIQEEPKPSYTAGRVAAMVSGISEEPPKPNTGAIKKVFVPGEDARVIKEDTDIEGLRSITEQSVNAEQNRIQKNAENVYLDQNMPNTSNDDSQERFKPINGQMNLDDVLVEWEHIKQENAQKHQEEIKKRVKHQTGKIIASFNDSVKNEIIDEFEEKKDISMPGTDDEGDGSAAQELIKALDESYGIEENGSGENTEHAGKEDADNQDIGRHAESNIGAAKEKYPSEEYNQQEEASNEDDHDNNEGSLNEEYSGDDGYAAEEKYSEDDGYASEEEYSKESGCAAEEEYSEEGGYASQEEYSEDDGYVAEGEYSEDDGYASEEEYSEEGGYASEEEYSEEGGYASEEEYSEDDGYASEEEYSESEEYVFDEVYSENSSLEGLKSEDEQLDPDDEESIAEMAKEDAMKTQEIKMNTAELSSLSDKILAATRKEANGARPEEIRDFSPEEQQLFENFAVTKKIKKQIIFALDKMTLAAYTGNVIITGEAELGTAKLAQNLVREFQAMDTNFSKKAAKITGEKLNSKNLKEVFDKLNNGAIIIEKANGMTEQKLYEMATLLNQKSISLIVIMADTKKEITRMLEKQAMIADFFNIRIDLMEMDSKALVAYAKNYALALEYSIDAMGELALYTRITNMQAGNHVVTKDEVRDIVDEAIWKSKKPKLKNFVDVLLAKRYDSEDMIVLKERDFM